MAKTRIPNDCLAVGQTYEFGGFQWEIARLGQYFVTFSAQPKRKYKRIEIAEQIDRLRLRPVK